jgi:flagellar hook-associated protein 3 FlgL
MDRVTTATSNSAILANLMRSQSAQQTAAEQVSSGKIGTDLKAYAPSAETLTATRAVKSRVDGYVTQNTALGDKLTAQNLALTQTADSADGARQTVLSALAAGSGTGLKATLQSWLSTAVQSLNTQYGGHYLFSGGQVDTQPVATKTLSDLTAAPLADAFKNDQLAPTSRLDETTTLPTGFLADKLGTGLFTAFQQVQSYLDANGGDFPQHLDDAATSFLNGVVSQFQTANTDLTAAAAQNGLNQSRVDDAKTAQTDRQTMLTGVLGDITDVDSAEAVSRLQLAQTTTQASAKVFQTLQDSSLLNVLK